MSETVQILTVVTTDAPYTVTVPPGHTLTVDVQTSGALSVHLAQEVPCYDAHPAINIINGQISGREPVEHTHPRTLSVRFFAPGYWQYMIGEEEL